MTATLSVFWRGHRFLFPPQAVSCPPVQTKPPLERTSLDWLSTLTAKSLIMIESGASTASASAGIGPVLPCLHRKPMTALVQPGQASGWCPTDADGEASARPVESPSAHISAAVGDLKQGAPCQAALTGAQSTEFTLWGRQSQSQQGAKGSCFSKFRFKFIHTSVFQVD